MAHFYDLSNLNSSQQNIGDFLRLPATSYPYFYAWILAGIWFIITLTLYYKGKERFGKENLLSCMAISSFSILVLSLVGTILTIISLEIMIYILVISLTIMIIWFFSN